MYISMFTRYGDFNKMQNIYLREKINLKDYQSRWPSVIFTSEAEETLGTILTDVKDLSVLKNVSKSHKSC